MNQTHQFIQVSMHRALQKLSVQCGPQESHVVGWFELYNLKWLKPKVRVLKQSCTNSDYIIPTILGWCRIIQFEPIQNMENGLDCKVDSLSLCFVGPLIGQTILTMYLNPSW